MIHRAAAIALCACLACLCPAADPTAIATIDLAKVINTSSLVDNRMADLKDEVGEVQASLKRYEEEIKRLQTDIGIYDEEDEKYHDYARRLEVLKLEYKLYNKRHRARLDAMETAVFKDAYRMIRKLLTEYCSSKDIELVLLQSPKTLASQRMVDFSAELITHTVLYADKDADITEAFIAYVDEREPRKTDGGSKPAFDLGVDDPASNDEPAVDQDDNAADDGATEE